MIRPINSTNNINFTSTGRLKTFLVNNYLHIATQATSFVAAQKYISPIETPSDLIRRKILIDLGETLSNIMMGKKITGENQCTNIFANAADCSRDVINFIKRHMGK